MIDGLLTIPKGRALLEEELEFMLPEGWRTEMAVLIEQGKVSVIPGVELAERRCNRCGGGEVVFTDCGSCGKTCAYCETCLQLGRSRACSQLYLIADDDPETGEGYDVPLQWSGSLTPAQREAADRAVEIITLSSQKLLIWAVCGAGKTEVTFYPIEQALQLGQKVMLVTPRKDVVLELLPRFQKAFPTVRIIALHGKSKEKWEEAELTLSTTHQALRFYHKFDLVVIDEVDAYPYHNNPMLYYAVERARKPQGNLLYLSATPPMYLRNIPHVRIPARYHRQPLAVPQILLIRGLNKKLSGQKSVPDLVEMIKFIGSQGRQGYVFVPRIELVDQLVNQLNKLLEIEGTHSRDPQREEKVQLFREGKIRVLVTTTILERGVTVPKTDVIVVQADAPIFDEASLVQMSGRAGRALEDPIGHVVFVAQERTREMKKAIKHIQVMNKLAKKRGLIEQ